MDIQFSAIFEFMLMDSVVVIIIIFQGYQGGSDWSNYFLVNFMVSLRTGFNRHMCAGSIYLHGKWILTARSCLIDNRTKEGNHMYAYPTHSRWMHNNEKEKFYTMSKSFCHPFVKNQPDVFTDIGLIKLRESITPEFKHLGIWKISLIREDLDLGGYYDKESVYVSGWGRTNPAEPEPQDRIRRGFFQIKHPIVCKQDPMSVDFKHPNHICLRCKDEYVNPCYGDEGGPALFNGYPHYRLLGIVPAIPNRCLWHTFVMNITHFRKFIDDVIRNEPAKYECRNIREHLV
ncbi:mite allergen Der f 6-like [Brevipalpus obovatus]|uniref:mite allergen Der f 6-like n=1 Tax=Brevipalpus obovatus TaxID=246614 RepID=UPI003D9F1EE1